MNQRQRNKEYGFDVIRQCRIRDYIQLEHGLISFCTRRISLNLAPSKPNVTGSSIQIAQIKDSAGSADELEGTTCLNQHLSPLLQYPKAVALTTDVRDKTRTRTRCKVPTGLALVVRGQILMFAMLEFAAVASITAPGSVIVPTDPPRF
jgi:hypothetical protein